MAAPGRQNDRRRRARCLLNAAIVVLAGVLAVRLAIVDGDDAGMNETEHPRVVQPGANLSTVAGWEPQGARTVLLFMRTTCPICTDSVPFYQRLSSRLSAYPNIRFVVASSEPATAIDAWIEQYNIAADSTVVFEDVILSGFVLTPTLLVVDSQSAVTDVMMGRSSIEDESSLWARILDPAHSPRVDNSYADKEIDSSELAHALTSSDAVQVVDIRERDADTGQAGRRSAIRIPYSELEQRAPIELSKDGTVIVDCSVATIASCRVAAMSLRRLEFTDVAIFSPRWKPRRRPTQGSW